jgi:hypothetical protein
MNKLFLGAKEWFADAADHSRLTILDSKITGLKDDLDWQFYPSDRYEIEILLDLYCRAYNKILARIKARNDRHQFSIIRVVTR